MGNLEKEIKKEIRASKIQTIILSTIAISGILAVSMLAPNAMQMMKLFDLDKKKKLYKGQSINNSRKRLLENGLIEYEKDGFLKLTNSGRKILEKFERKNFKVKIPKKWDKKWRILIFDIKEKKRFVRDQIRITLNNIGFIKLQNSVWIFPYDCEDFITLLKADFGIGKEVLYIIADKVENEKAIKNHFNLV